MRDPMTFETRLTDAFAAYTAAAPVQVDAAALTAELAHRRAWRRLALPRTGTGTLRMAFLLGLLALAAVGVALLAGGYLRPTPAPIGGGGRIFAWLGAGNGRLLAIGDAGIVASDIRSSTVCPLVLGSADGTAANVRFKGIVIRDFDGGGGTTIDVNYAGGERWSADGSALAQLIFDDPSVIFTTFPGGDVARPVTRRVNLAPAWPPGTDFNGAFSGDGSTFVAMRMSPNGAPPDPTIVVVDVAGGPPRMLELSWNGEVPAWDFITAVSPDGSSAVVRTADGQLAMISTTTGDVTRLGRPDDAADTDYLFPAWSPDGRRLAIAVGGRLEIVDLASAAWISTPLIVPAEQVAGAGFYDGRRQVAGAWSSDGRRIASVNGTVLSTFDIATGSVTTRRLPSAVTAWSPDRSVLGVLVPTDGDPAMDTATVLAVSPWDASEPSLLATITRPQEPFSADASCIQWLPEVRR